MKFNKVVFRLVYRDVFDPITAHIWAQNHPKHTFHSQMAACSRFYIRCCVADLRLSSKTNSLTLLNMHWLPYLTCDLESCIVALDLLEMLYPFELTQHDVPPELFQPVSWDTDFAW